MVEYADKKQKSKSNDKKKSDTGSTIQRNILKQPILRKENNTGLPDNLKSGVENLSGYSMDDVKVHYNSDKPAQLNAHAYAQGSDIHLASGQEKHLPHEAWHVVQQKQGRVKPTMQMKDKIGINDDVGLEREADVMGSKAIRINQNTGNAKITNRYSLNQSPIQRIVSLGKNIVTDRLNVAGENHAKDSEEADKQLMINSGLDVSKYFTEYQFKYNQASLKDDIEAEELEKIPPADPVLTGVLSSIYSSRDLLKESIWIITKLVGLVNAYFNDQINKWDKWEVALKYNDNLKDLISSLDVAYLGLYFFKEDIDKVLRYDNAERLVDGIDNDVVSEMREIEVYDMLFESASKFNEQKTLLSGLGLENQLTELENDDVDESWLKTGSNITFTSKSKDDLLSELQLILDCVELDFECVQIFEDEYVELYKRLAGEIPLFGDENEKSDADELDTERSRYMHEAANKNVSVKGLWKIGEYHVQDIIKTPDITNQYNLIPRNEYRKLVDGKKLTIDKM